MTQESRSTALVLPTSLEEVRGMAEAFVKSGMFTDIKQLSQAIVKIQAGRELGLAPVFSMMNINLIRGRLTTSANTMAMLVKRSGNYDYRIKEHTDNICTIVFHQKDGNKWVEVGTSSFSIEDAKRADLLKPDSGWVKFPRAMLFSRAISQGARIYCPDAIGGVYTDEEIRSIPPRPGDGDTTMIDVFTDEITKPDPSPVASGSTPAVVEAGSSSNPSTSPIDLVWLRENIELIKSKGKESGNLELLKAWSNTNIVSYLNIITNSKGTSVREAVIALSPEQAAEFVKRIEDTLELLRKEDTKTE